MRVFLCEKPSQAADVARVVGANERGDGVRRGAGVVVTWCFGHLLELAPPDAYDAAWGKWSMDHLPMLPSEWKFQLRQDSKHQLAVIRQCLRTADEVVIATDAGREGELIARNVLEELGWKGTTWRLWVSAMDDQSLTKALNSLIPGDVKLPLYHAAVARARADWLVGMNLTRAMSVASGSWAVLSIGRVQTPTLKLIVDRDQAIERFVPKPWYAVEITVGEVGASFVARWLPGEHLADDQRRCINESAAVAITESVSGVNGTIVSVETKRQKEPPPLPHSLSTLQQEANRKFGYTAKQVLDAAQALYEKHKAISYPRTDCQYLARPQHAEAPTVLTAISSADDGFREFVRLADFSQMTAAWDDTKLSDHHAIIPTAQPPNLAALSPIEARLFDMVRRNYVAQFLPEFVYDKTSVRLVFAGEVFAATGRSIKAAGWKVVFKTELEQGAETDTDDATVQTLPGLQEGKLIRCQKSEVHRRKTKPARHFTDGDLEEAMARADRYIDDPRLKAVMRTKEKIGIGTIATRAGIIETLLARKYVERQGKFLISTNLGKSLIETVPPHVADPATTALWELSLEEIAAGRASMDSFLDRQSAWVNSVVQMVKQDVSSVNALARSADAARIESGGKAKGGRGGGRRCGAAPAGSRSKSGSEIAVPEKQLCTKCKVGHFQPRVARSGSNVGRGYLACSNRACGGFQWLDS